MARIIQGSHVPGLWVNRLRMIALCAITSLTGASVVTFVVTAATRRGNDVIYRKGIRRIVLGCLAVFTATTRTQSDPFPDVARNSAAQGIFYSMRAGRMPNSVMTCRSERPRREASVAKSARRAAFASSRRWARVVKASPSSGVSVPACRLRTRERIRRVSASGK